MNLLLKCVRTCAAAIALSVLAIPPAWGTTDDVDTSKTLRDGRFSFGYRGVNSTGEHSRALEYSLLEAGPTFGLVVKGSRGQRHFSLEADYLTESDYYSDAHLDFKGLIRLDLLAESLYHNLEHIPYDPPFRNDGVFGGEEVVTFDDLDPGDDYHVEVERYSAALRAKLPDMPAHLNLSYWRLERSGEKQLRFLDENCSSCHMQSKTRELDRVTDEVTAGVDAHLGWFDLIFEQLYRQFRDREPIPLDPFEAHDLRIGSDPLDPGTWRQHDETPDSRLIQSSLKMHTSVAGGLVGAASFAVGKRENRSDLSDVYPVESKTDFRKAAGDVTYIPSRELTLNLRYRLLDLENSNTDRITAEGLVQYKTTVSHNPIEVRDNVDLERASYSATLSYRPSRRITFKGDYEREEIRRGNTGGFTEGNVFTDPIQIDPVWELSEDETIDRFRLSVYARPFGNSRLRVNGWYQYLTADDPAYGNSAAEGHQTFLGGTWSPSPGWGASANAKLISETNDEHGLIVLDETDPADGELFFDLDRERESQNLTAGLWMNMSESLRMSLNYGFLRTHILQDLLFGDTLGGLNEDFATLDENVEYSQRVHTTSLSADWLVAQTLRAVAEARYIDSYSAFEPGFVPRSLDFGTGAILVDAGGLKGLSEVDIRQTGLRFDLVWSPADEWSWTARYTLDDYDDRNSDVFDGTAETYMVSLARSW